MNSVLSDAEKLYDFLSDAPRAEHADLILAAGSHDLRVADFAAELYLAGAAPLVVCTGGFGKMTESRFSAPEGELFAARCREHGVPKSAILIENRSTNTGENFRFAQALLTEKGIFPAAGIAVSKPYMAKRVWATGSKQWSEVSWYTGIPPLRFEEYPTEEVPLESTIQLMVGDLLRCREYAERGFQVPIEIPDDVMAACMRLVQAGYDQYVL